MKIFIEDLNEISCFRRSSLIFFVILKEDFQKKRIYEDFIKIITDNLLCLNLHQIFTCFFLRSKPNFSKKYLSVFFYKRIYEDFAKKRIYEDFKKNSFLNLSFISHFKKKLFFKRIYEENQKKIIWEDFLLKNNIHLKEKSLK